MFAHYYDIDSNVTGYDFPEVISSVETAGNEAGETRIDPFGNTEAPCGTDTDQKKRSGQRFSLRTRLMIGCAFNSGVISAADLAMKYQCDPSYVYRLGVQAELFLDAYASEEYESATGIIPITKEFVRAAVICLRVICQASEEDTVRFIQLMFHQRISVSTVSNICIQYGRVAADWNAQVPLNNICIGANDEIFFGRAQRQMILAGIDLKSTYIYGATISYDRKAETWQLFMMFLQDQGLDLKVSISDAGASLIKGIQDTFTDCFSQLDVFHTLKDLGEPCSQLERKALGLLGELYEKELTLQGPKPHKKTRDRCAELKENIVMILMLVDEINLLFSWVRELLDFTGYSRYETENLLRWIVIEMRNTIERAKPYSGLISMAKMRYSVDVFANRIVKSLSFIDFVSQSLNTISDQLGVDPSALHMLYRMQAFLPSSVEYGFMSDRVNKLLRDTNVTRDALEGAVKDVIGFAERASSMIENVNSRLRTALNDSRGMNALYLALLIMYLNTKEYRRSGVDERKGKSPYELLTGEKVSFLDVLFPDFQPVLPVWRKYRKIAKAS